MSLIEKTKLLAHIEKLKPGLTKKGYDDKSDFIRFDDGIIYSYNSSIMVIVPTLIADINGAVRAKELYNLVKCIDSEQIELTQNDKNIIVHASQVKAQIKTTTEFNPPIEYLEFPEDDFNALDSLFMESLRTCASVCSTNPMNTALTHIHIFGEYMESLWDCALQYVRCILGTPMPDILIPRSSAIDLLKYTDISAYYIKNNWMYFTNRTENIFYATRIIDNEAKVYPDCSNIIRKAIDIDNLDSTVVVTFAESIVPTLNQVMIFTDTDDVSNQLVDVLISPSRAIFSSTNENGTIKSTVRLTHPIPKTIEFKINPNLLKKCENKNLSLRVSDSVVVTRGNTTVYVTRISKGQAS